jgi:hypothetical protein
MASAARIYVAHRQASVNGLGISPLTSTICGVELCDLRQGFTMIRLVTEFGELLDNLSGYA